MGPVSLIAGCWLGYEYYQKNQNIVAGLAVCIISPFIINILVSIILKIWHKAFNKDKVIPLSTISRLSASAFNILWGGSYLAILLVLVAVAPLEAEWFQKAKHDVLKSRSYAVISGLVNDRIPNGSFDVKKVISALQDPAKLQELESTEELKALREDDRLNELFADEETAEQIRDKDYGKLLSNPKMQAVFQDKELLRKLFALNQRIAEESVEEEERSVEESGPKVIDIPPEESGN